MNKQLRNNMIVLLFAVILSLILNAAHILLPFMFGPIIASVICVRVFRLEIEWPFWLSQIGNMTVIKIIVNQSSLISNITFLVKVEPI
jgi:uncharacterized membrane protein AbrB (regulator of aidB expression)